MRFSPYTRILALTTMMVGLALRLGAQTAAQQAVSSYDGLIQNYNLITFGNATLDNYGDTQGGLAIGGNLTLSSAGSIATDIGNTSTPTLYVNGQLSLQNNAQTYLSNGFASTPNVNTNTVSNGTWTWSTGQDQLTNTKDSGFLSTINSSASNKASDPLTNNATPGWNWTTLQSQMVAISNTLAATTATGTISVSPGQVMSFVAPTGVTSGVVVFDLNANLLTGSGNVYNGKTFSTIQFNVPNNVNFVINVVNAAGKTIFGSGVNFNTVGNSNQLLWNIEPATSGTTTVSIEAGGQFAGSVLAPDVNLDNAMCTVINGQIVADEFTDDGEELHDTDFTSCLVPEPGVYGAGAALLCGLAIGGRQWRDWRKVKNSAAPAPAA
jgi:hypothetical protein